MYGSVDYGRLTSTCLCGLPLIPWIAYTLEEMHGRTDIAGGEGDSRLTQDCLEGV